MTTVRKMPVGTQSFQILQENDFVYIDKTRYIYQLVSQSRVYFLSRPRRFGKSLLLSTLAAYFQGKRELFKGLYLEEAEEELAKQEGREAWMQYPVLYLDLNAKNYENEEALIERLSLNLQQWEEEFNLERISKAPEERFTYIIRRAYEKTGQQIVVLIDEYDKPLLDTINKPKLNTVYRDTLGAFYSVIKSCDQYLRFAFLTGVTKFSKVSVFSGLNNLRDISLLPDFAAICGITEEELKANFAPEIEVLANKLKLSVEETLETLRKRYDGYLFSEEGENVYNPFSLLNTFASRILKDYWYATGTPTFLVEYLKEAHYFIPDLEGNVLLDDYGLDKNRADPHDPVPILFQTGYLTIKEYVSSRNYYRLGYPNDEVRYGFLNNLRSSFLPPDRGLGISIFKFLHDIDTQDVSAFMERLQTVFANLPYDTVAKEDIKFRERDYQIVVYLIFALLGQYVQTEVQSVTGRADCVVDTPTTVYIFELKLWSTGTAEDALTQIRTKGYDTPYKSSGKEVILIGASFDTEKRNIGEWKVERL